METLRKDLLYAVRKLVRSPGFTAVAVVALALGIGANTAIFSAVNGVLLRPLNYADPGGLVWLSEKSQHMDDMSISLPNFLDWEKQNRSFEDIGISRYQGFTLTGRDDAERLEGYMVSSGYFRALGVKPILGRILLPEEDHAGAQRVVVLNNRMWRNRLGSDPQVLDRTLVLEGVPTKVVGVMPPGFEEDEVDLYMPVGPFLDRLPAENRDNHPGFYGVARLKPGVTLERARADMDAIARRLAQEYPDSNEGTGIRVERLTDMMVGDVRPALLVLLAAVGFVLLIACSNVANLLLARAEARTRELAIRTSLGAGRGRIVRQLLTESALLALLGGILGLLLAVWAIDMLVSVNPGNIPRVEEIGVDGRVLAFSLAVSLLTGLLFGLAPALKASRPDLNSSLKEGATAALAGIRRQPLRSGLIVTEVALTLVLLVGAGLMLKSFRQLRSVDPGFRKENVLAMRVPPPDVEDPEAARWMSFYREVVERVQALPGVGSAAVSSAIPMEGGGSESGVVAEGQPFPDSPEESTLTQWQMVSPEYFSTLRVPIMRGRSFAGSDREGAVPVAIVDETMAKRLWPDENPVGKRIAFEFKGESIKDPQPVWREVVGVVGHTRHYGLAGVSRVQIYVPFEQRALWAQPKTVLALFVRGRSNPAELTAAIRREVAHVDPATPVFDVQTMEEVVASQLAQPRFSSLLLGGFAGVALTLAAIGIYGLVAYTVTRRTREIGLRMALGARAPDVLRMVVKQGMALVLLGLALGLIAALVLSRFMSSLLYEVSAWDPGIFAGVALLLTSIAFVATYIPARRATRIDPLVALRYE
jgi:predicted permease